MKSKRGWGTTQVIGIAIAVLLLLVLVYGAYMMSKGMHLNILSGP